MEERVLSDKDQFPTEEIIFSHIGKAKAYWESLFRNIHSSHPEITEQWRYYNDGKSWLLKVTKKKKTIFWLSLLKGTFKIAFYFGDKAEPVIMTSNISKELETQFKDGKKYGKIRGISLTINSNDDVESVLDLIEIKLKVK
jgi:hypothetical protein